MLDDAPAPRRILVASSHTLFREGLRSLLRSNYGSRVEIVGSASSTAEVLAAMETHAPDLVIVDYDDHAISRKTLLEHFVEGHGKTRVVLLSLKEGGEVVVYDRRTLAATQMEDWLEGELQLPAAGRWPGFRTPSASAAAPAPREEA